MDHHNMNTYKCHHHPISANFGFVHLLYEISTIHLDASSFVNIILIRRDWDVKFNRKQIITQI